MCQALRERPRKFLLFLLALLPPLSLVWSGALSPAAASEPVLLETTLFLGEAVPLRLGNQRLEEVLAEHFSDEGQVECWWVGPQGPAPLERLGKERPTAQTDYRLTAVLHRESDPDVRINFLYRTWVEYGSITVAASGEGLSPESSALFKLEGKGLTLYRCAQPGQDPATLEVEFTGLPFGAYQVTAEDPALSPQQVQCLVGVCKENDTVSTQRRKASARFTAERDPGGAVWESYRLGAEP